MRRGIPYTDVRLTSNMNRFFHIAVIKAIEWEKTSVIIIKSHIDITALNYGMNCNFVTHDPKGVRISHHEVCGEDKM